MRWVLCDQFEFDPPDAEQKLDMAVATASRHCPDLTTFLAACGASAREGLVKPQGWNRWRQISEHLSRFAGVDLPHPSQIQQMVILRDEWDDVEVGITNGSVFVWYHWLTTA